MDFFSTNIYNGYEYMRRGNDIETRIAPTPPLPAPTATMCVTPGTGRCFGKPRLMRAAWCSAREGRTDFSADSESNVDNLRANESNEQNKLG